MNALRLSCGCGPRLLPTGARAVGVAAIPTMSASASPPAAQPGTLEGLRLDNQTLRELPVDTSRNRRQRSTPGVCFALVDPEPLQNPQLVAASQDALALLDLEPGQVDRPDFAEYMSGNRLIPGAQPAAHAYCGHQFGYFSGQLGDGAAMYLGEVVNAQGQRWELQFKGAGQTPYSRSADGRKVLRSSVREFLCSEAMYYLGIPTTRAGTCVTSDTLIVRDPLYDGNAIRERATVITRIAPTFLRFGSFEIFKPTDNVTGRTGPSAGLEPELLPRLLHFTLRNYFPELWARHGGDALAAEHPAGNEPAWHPLYADWLTEVAVRTASLVAAWQGVGWCHGVLNTDNMSIVGVTIDYGPFGFMDGYNPRHVPNGSDDGGRYSYEAQPSICRWNIEKLGEAVRWAVPERITREALDAYDTEYDRAYMALLRRKLGLVAVTDDGEDGQLVTDVLQVMADAGADWTNAWRALARLPLPTGPDVPPSGPEYDQLLGYLVAQGMAPDVLAKARDTTIPHSNLAMLQMLATKDPATLHAMGATPQQIEAEAAKARDAVRFRKMTKSEKEAADRAAWDGWLKRYSARLWREVAAGATNDTRRSVMNATNPRYVLRNWMAHEAIQKAEKGDFIDVQGLLRLLSDPFTTVGEDAAFAALVGGAAPPAAAQPGQQAEVEGSGAACPMPKYDGRPPAWASKLCVTCSS